METIRAKDIRGAAQSRMTIDEMIAVLQAAKIGMTIQFRDQGDSFTDIKEEWMDCQKPAFDFSHFDYRIKPTPREWVAEVLPNGHLCTTFTGFSSCGGQLIKVREVT